MEHILYWDQSILRWIAEYLRNDSLTTFLSTYSSLINHGIGLVALGVILLFFRKTRIWGCYTLIALAIGVLIGEYGIKLLVQRARPFVESSEFTALMPEPSGWSFPSSHTMMSFTVAAVWCRMNWKVGIVTMVAAALMGFSRIYLCVHYPSDVIVGMVLGIVVGLATVWIGQAVTEYIHYNKIKRIQ